MTEATQQTKNLMNNTTNVKTSTLSMMRAEPVEDHGSVITEQAIETLERPSPARSPVVQSPQTIHSNMVMQELADREVEQPESRSRGGNDNGANNQMTKTQYSLTSSQSNTQDNETFNGHATGPISPIGSGNGSPIKQYDELAQTFRERDNKTPSGMADKKVGMKESNFKSKNKMQHAIHIRIENNGSPDVEDNKTTNQHDSIQNTNSQRPGSNGGNYGNVPQSLQKKTMQTSSRELLEVYNPDLSYTRSKKRLAEKNPYNVSPVKIDKVNLSNDYEQMENSPLKPKKRGTKLNVKNEQKIKQLKNVGSSELMAVIANMQLSAVEIKDGSGSPKKKTLNFPPGSMMKAAVGMSKTNNFEGLLKGKSFAIQESPFQNFRKEIRKRGQEQIKMQISHEDLFNQQSVSNVEGGEDTQSDKDPREFNESQVDAQGIITFKQRPLDHYPSHAMLINGKFGGQITGSRKVSTKDGMLLSRDLIQVISQRDSEETIPASAKANQKFEQKEKYKLDQVPGNKGGENQGSSMTFYDESEQGTNPMLNKGRIYASPKVKQQKILHLDDEDLLQSNKLYSNSRVPNLSARKLSPQLHNLKLNLASFSVKHNQAVKRSEEKIINLFANSGALPKLPQAAMQTHQFQTNIPRINMMLSDTKGDLISKDSVTTKFKKSFNSSRNKSFGAPRDATSTLFPAARKSPMIELNYQMAPQQAVKDKQSGPPSKNSISLQTSNSFTKFKSNSLASPAERGSAQASVPQHTTGLLSQINATSTLTNQNTASMKKLKGNKGAITLTSSPKQQAKKKEVEAADISGPDLSMALHTSPITAMSREPSKLSNVDKQGGATPTNSNKELLNKKKHTLQVQRSGKLKIQEEPVDQYQGMLQQGRKSKLGETLNLQSNSALKPPSALQLRNKENELDQLESQPSPTSPQRSTKLLKKQNTEDLENHLKEFKQESQDDIENRLATETMKKAEQHRQDLDVNINKQNTNPLVERESNASVLEQIHSIQGSVYQFANGMMAGVGTKTSPGKFAMTKSQITERLDDAQTLEPTESALAGFPGSPYAQVPVTQIQTQQVINDQMSAAVLNSSNKGFPLNVTGMRQVIQQTSSIFPMEAPPIHYNFNSTQYKKQIKELEGTHNTPFGYTKAKPSASGTLSPSRMPEVELQIQSHTQKISARPANQTTYNRNTYRSQNNSTPMQQASHLASIHGGQNLDMKHTLTAKRATNPFISPKNSHLMEVAKRFKNTSNRKAPQSYHSDHTYKDCQNQSQYNNSYQYNNDIPAATNAFTTRQNSQGTLSKQISTEVLKESPTKKRQYAQRKLSHPNRPTQLEIGGEGAPMLSLLPPLKTREISPRYNYSVGRRVKEQLKVGSAVIASVDGESSPRTLNTKKQTNKSKKSFSVPKVIKTINVNSLNETQTSYREKSKLAMMTQPSQQYEQENYIVNEMEEVGMDDITDGKDIDPNLTGMNNMAGMERLNQGSGVFDQSVRHLGPNDGFLPGKATALLLEQSNQELRNPYIRDDTTSFRHVLLSRTIDPENYNAAIHLKQNPPTYNDFNTVEQLANIYHKDVVVSLDHQRKLNDMIIYQRRELNLDGTWKEKARARSKMREGANSRDNFHFLEYANQGDSNFKNPLEVLKSNFNTRVGPQIERSLLLNKPEPEKIEPKNERKNKKKMIINLENSNMMKVEKKEMHGPTQKMKKQKMPSGVTQYQIQIMGAGKKLTKNDTIKDSIEQAEEAYSRDNNTRYQEPTRVDNMNASQSAFRSHPPSNIQISQSEKKEYSTFQTYAHFSTSQARSYSV